MLKLYLENTLVELSEDFSCPITKTFEDLQNPTSIKNDFSKSIVIPHTQKNDSLFGHLYNPDRLTAAPTNNTLKGIYFDPYKKIDFRIEWNDSVVMVGYLKVLSVDSKGYNCTLNGELGKIFQEMQKLTFDPFKYTGEDKDKYWIDSSQYVNTKITKELVWDSWNSNGQTDLVLRKVDDPDYKVTDIIGFTPNNAFNSGFDYSSIDRTTSIITLQDRLKQIYGEDSFTQKFGVSISAVKDASPVELLQFRSYLQQPFIYTNKLFSIVKEKIEKITGYKITLDPVLQNDSRYTESVMLLDIPEDRVEYINKYENETIRTGKLFDATYGGQQGLTFVYDLVADQEHTNITTLNTTPIVSLSETPLLNIVTGKYSFPDGVDVLKFNAEFPIAISGYIEQDKVPVDDWEIDLRPFDLSGIGPCAIECDIDFLDDENNSTYTLKGFIIPKTMDDETIQRLKDSGIMDLTNNATRFNTFIFKNGYVGNSTNCLSNNTIIFSEQLLRREVLGDSFSMKITIRAVGMFSTPFVRVGSSSLTGLNALTNFSIYNSVCKWAQPTGTTKPVIEYTTTRAQTFDVVKNYWNSGVHFDLSLLFDNTKNPFTVLLEYFKALNVYIKTDFVKKSIDIIPKSKYFANYKTVQWGDKINKAQEYTIAPIAFSTKNTLFDTTTTSEFTEKYKQLTSYSYGAKNIETRYNFNTTTSIIANLPTIILYSPTISNLHNIIFAGSDSSYYYITRKLTIGNFSSGNKYKSQFGKFAFIKKENFASNDGSYSITDSTNAQFAVNTFCHIDINTNSQERKPINTYLSLSHKTTDGKSIYFAAPLENYTTDATLYNARYLYNSNWKSYIEERYNSNNKLVTCYLDLTPTDFINFEFNKFLLIENQLYMVNKIYDYDINSNEPTKVDLITIQNIDGYTK